MSTGLRSAGVTIEIATSVGTGETEEGVHAFPRSLSFYWTAPSFHSWMKEHARDYTVIHIHGVFSWMPTVAAHHARRAGVPYILRTLGHLDPWSIKHGHSILKRMSIAINEKRMLEGAAAIHVTGDEEARSVSRIARGNIVVIPLGVDVDPPAPTGAFRALYPETAGSAIVLYVSRIHPKKGFDLLLPAFARVVNELNEKPVLVVAGTGDPGYLADLRHQASALGLTDRIIWTGFLEGADKAAALADAKVSILPSYAENFALSVVEAMAAGLPVVITDQVGVHGEVERAQAGIVTRCDVGEIASALARLLTDEPLRQALGRNAHTLAGEKYSNAAMVRSLLDLYERLSEPAT
jgi:glycosyltransferase involved in cell wall biosynthesis